VLCVTLAVGAGFSLVGNDRMAQIPNYIPATKPSMRPAAATYFSAAST